MSKSFRSSAALFAVTLVLTGCGGGSSSSKKSTLSASSSGFPGGTVAANYLSDDKQAFSNSGQQMGFNPLRMFWNRSNGQAIGAFTTTPSASGGQNTNLLYLAWFDGAAWHAPVEVHGRNEDADDDVDDVMVLWLNTTGSTDATTLARNGDAIILFTRDDTAAANPVDDDTNTRLFGAYFDVSAAAATASGTVQGGFDTLATIIDFDNTILAANTVFSGLANDNDPEVQSFAFASDSLAGSHELAPGSDNLIDSGDVTTFVHLLYCKDPTSGNPLATEVQGLRWWSVPFDLTQVGNAIPSATAGSVIALGANIDTAANTEDVSDTVTVHNGHVFATVTDVVQSTGTGSVDTVLVAYAFNTAATPTLFEVNSARTATDDSDDVATRPAAANTYGADHGLASTLFFFEETGFHDTGATGSRSANRDHMLGELPVAAAGVTTVGTGSPMDIDGFQGLIDTANVDADGHVVRVGAAAGDPGFVDAGALQTRINRTGTAIVALWVQQNSDRTDLDDALNTIGLHTKNRIPFVAAVQTRLDATDTRLLTASIAAVGSALGVSVPALGSSATTTPTSGQSQANVTNVRFQEGLAGGQATSQANDSGALFGVPADRGSSFQGNPLRVNFTFTQGADLGGTDTDNTVLYLNGVTITLGAAPATAPTMAFTNTTAAASRVEELDNIWSADLGTALSVDAGDATATTAAGRVLVFFPSNGNNELENIAGSFDEQRLFVSEQTAAGQAGAKALVSSDPAATFQTNAMQQRTLGGLMVVPVNTNTVGAPAHVGERIHLYWTEERDAPGTGSGAGLRLATRSYSQAATTAAVPVALGSRFVPALPTTPGTGAPAFIDLPTSGNLFDSFFFNGRLVGGRNGETAGVYFDEDRHLYYTETASDASAYPKSSGVADPALVDDDAPANVDLYEFEIYFSPLPNNLADSQATWQRADNGSPTNGRLFVRTHN